MMGGDIKCHNCGAIFSGYLGFAAHKINCWGPPPQPVKTDFTVLVWFSRQNHPEVVVVTSATHIGAAVLSAFIGNQLPTDMGEVVKVEVYPRRRK